MKKDKEELTKLFNERLIAEAITECRQKIKHLSTNDALMATYLLLNEYFRLCCVRQEEKNSRGIAKKIYDDLLKEIDDIAFDRD